MKIKMSNKFITEILSLAIAVVLWFIVGNINDPVKTRPISGIPVQIVNEEVLESINKVYEITEGDTVSITVRGKQSIVEQLSTEDFTATADLSKLSIVNAVPIDVSLADSSTRSQDVEITLGRVNTMKVKIEDRAETMIPVTVETKGEVASGYAIGSKSSSPNMVEVSGSESLIQRLKEIKVQVDVDGASKNISTRQSVKFYDQNGDAVESASIECETAAVDVVVELWHTKEIPLTMETTGEPADGYGISSFDYEPKTVTIAAGDKKLNKITKLELDPLDVSGRKESLENTSNIDSSYLPEDVIFPSSTIDIVAKAVIEKKVTKEIKIDSSDITVKGLKKGEKVSFKEKSHVIHVESYPSKISGVDGKSFDPYINVSEIDEETGEVSVHLTNPDGIMVTDTLKVEVVMEE